MNNIDDLGSKTARLKDQLRAAQSAYDAARIDASPVKVGQIYINKRGQRGQVVHLGVRFDTVRAYIAVIRKNGAIGVLKREMHRWDGWVLEGSENTATPVRWPLS